MRSAARALALALAASPIAPGAAADAQVAYPTRPVRVVVPFPAGGTADLLARAAAQKLSATWGQRAIVDNRPGAGGNIGAELVAKAPPDGYTLLMSPVGVNASRANPHPKVPYGPVKDFVPVILVAGVPNVLVVHPSLPVNSVEDLIAYAKANPGRLSFASSGSGTSVQLSGELFKVMTDVQMTQVTYMTSAAALADLVGGHMQLMFDELPSSLALIKAGKLRALAVTSVQRSPMLPDVPTVAESGVPGFEASSWFGLLAPAGTPRDVVTKINADTQQWLASPDAKDKLAAQAAAAAGGSPEDFTRHVQDEAAKWARVARQPGVKAE